MEEKTHTTLKLATLEVQAMPNEALLAPLLPTTPQAFHLETFLGVVRQVPERPKLQGIHSKLLKWVT